jgi:hypothetical protein
VRTAGDKRRKVDADEGWDGMSRAKGSEERERGWVGAVAVMAAVVVRKW